MSNFVKCEICGKYSWTGERHKCSPIFYFKHEDWGDEFEEIRATDFDDAALEFAKLYNENGDYPLMDSEEEVIISDGKTEKRYIVSAEQSIEYNVKEKEVEVQE